ncbi:MAG: heme-degrading domain-containing protein [Anaerolineales bacterium]
METILSQLLQEEAELQFERFNKQTAWQLGSLLVERATAQDLPVTIDIMRGEQQLFHAALPGASADNDEWIKRKVRVVYRFGHSSFYMGQKLKTSGKTIEEVYLIPESQFAAHGGCFPIIVRGTGMVGAATVSGLPQEEDHKLVTQVLREFLAKEQ